MLLWNIFLAAVWAFALGEPSLPNFVVGFVLGYAVLWLGRNVFGAADYCAKVPRLIELLLYFFWKLVEANLRVAHDVITPRHRMRPGIIAVPLDARTDNEISLLANILTLTPGTLSMEVSPDRRFLYVHSLYIRDVEAEKQAIKDGFERRLLEVLR